MGGGTKRCTVLRLKFGLTESQLGTVSKCSPPIGFATEILYSLRKRSNRLWVRSGAEGPSDTAGSDGAARGGRRLDPHGRSRRFC